MSGRFLLVGFDVAESASLSTRLPFKTIASEMLPRIVVEEGKLFVQSATTLQYLAVSHVIFHGIFENDIDFLSGLALWGGPCFPNPVAMLDCRLRLPCLIRALKHTKFGGKPRGFASAGACYDSNNFESVAKWGNWHCGENKSRFQGAFEAQEATLFEPFVQGEAVRIAILGDKAFQIKMTGEGWLKSVHGRGAYLMPADTELVEDTRQIQRGLGLDIIANDYIASETGSYLLEVNHIPSVTCFPELWEEYQESIVRWLAEKC
jgi:hypothetical protein